MTHIAGGRLAAECFLRIFGMTKTFGRKAQAMKQERFSA